MIILQLDANGIGWEDGVAGVGMARSDTLAWNGLGIIFNTCP